MIFHKNNVLAKVTAAALSKAKMLAFVLVLIAMTQFNGLATAASDSEVRLTYTFRS